MKLTTVDRPTSPQSLAVVYLIECGNTDQQRTNLQHLTSLYQSTLHSVTELTNRNTDRQWTNPHHLATLLWSTLLRQCQYRPTANKPTSHHSIAVSMNMDQHWTKPTSPNHSTTVHGTLTSTGQNQPHRTTLLQSMAH